MTLGCHQHVTKIPRGCHQDVLPLLPLQFVSLWCIRIVQYSELNQEQSQDLKQNNNRRQQLHSKCFSSVNWNGYVRHERWKNILFNRDDR